MLNLLVIGTDQSLLDTNSFALQRQCRYYEGWKVDILILGAGPAAQIQREGITVYRVGGKNKIQALVRTCIAVWSRARSRFYDGISVQDPLWSGMVGYIAILARKTSFFVQDHSGYFGRPPYTWAEKLLRPISFFLARHATRIRIVSSRSLRGLLAHGVLATVIDHIPVYSPLPTIAAPTYRPEARILFSVGRLEPEKGYESCLRAWAMLPHVQGIFVIAGDGQERKRYEDLCRTLGIEKRVQFIGHQSNLEAYWQQADVYIQPSFFEGWCRALLEAAAHGLPIISTDAGFIGDVLIADQSALVVSPNDVAAQAEAIERAWKDVDLRIRLGQSAAQAAQTRAWSEERVITAIRTHYLSSST